MEAPIGTILSRRGSMAAHGTLVAHGARGPMGAMGPMGIMTPVALGPAIMFLQLKVELETHWPVGFQLLL